jgi:LAO/AO transport system kinase
MISVKKICSGDKPALARAISLIENDSNKESKLLSSLFPYLGKAHRIGITGPPGVGKSTLVDELTRAIRANHKKVGVIAIDPTSIFSGGAILGDRIRMHKIGLDAGVFIRSMATRGCAGGISRATSEVADLIDASGKDYVIIETVGVGQSEVEIFKNVDTTILVLSPESGDAIQAMKAGIMEIANLIVVNKSDRAGADALVDAIRNAQQIAKESHSKIGKPAAIFKTEAINSIGVKEVADYLDSRWTELKSSGELDAKRRVIMKERLKSLFINRVEDKIWQNKKVESLINTAIDKILTGKDNPYRAVDRIIKSVLK